MLPHCGRQVLLLWAAPIGSACDNLKLKSLDLSNISLSDSDAHGVAEIVKRCRTLESLNLNNNHIGNSGADYILKALEHNQTITHVEMDNNVVGNATYSQIKTTLEQRLNSQLMPE